MSAPTFVSEHEVSSWSTTTSPKSVTFTPGSGNILVALMGHETSDHTADQITFTGGPTWTSQAEVIPNSSAACYLRCFTATGAGSSITPTGTIQVSSKNWGFNVLEFSGSNGIGAVNSIGSNATAATGTHTTLNLTTTQDNSAIAVIIADFNVTGTAYTFDTLNGNTPTVGNGEVLTSYAGSSDYDVLVAYYPDAGTAGTKTIGVSNSSSMINSIIAIEILGTTGIIESTLAAASADYWSNLNPYSTSSITVPPGALAVVWSGEGTQDAGNAIAVSDSGSHTWTRLNTYDPAGAGYALDYWYNNTGANVSMTITVNFTTGSGFNYVCAVDPLIIKNCANPSTAPPRIVATITNTSKAEASGTPSQNGSLFCLHYLQLNPSANVSSLDAGSAVDSSPASTVYFSGGPTGLGTIYQTATNNQTTSPVTVGAGAPTTAQSYGILVEYLPTGTVGPSSAVVAWIV